jgi:hypothetical protein
VDKIYKNDEHYAQANQLFEQLKQEKTSIVTTNLAVMETTILFGY